jgi:hypothetical protein
VASTNDAQAITGDLSNCCEMASMWTRRMSKPNRTQNEQLYTLVGCDPRGLKETRAGVCVIRRPSRTLINIRTLYPRSLTLTWPSIGGLAPSASVAKRIPTIDCSAREDNECKCCNRNLSQLLGSKCDGCTRHQSWRSARSSTISGGASILADEIGKVECRCRVRHTDWVWLRRGLRVHL